MDMIDKALHQITLSIDKLEATDQNLSKLLALATAAHQLLAEENEQIPQSLHTQAKTSALMILENILEQKLYINYSSKSSPNLQSIKQTILTDLEAVIHSAE